MNIDLIHINSLLASSFKKDASLGLANGKMGGCIYFYYLSRKENNQTYKTHAEGLLDSIFSNIRSIEEIDIKKGLGGIGIGIDYLIKNKYVQGDVNRILKDIDDLVFKNLNTYNSTARLNATYQTQLLYYLYTRLTELKESTEHGILLRELAIQVINELYDKIKPDFFEEPVGFCFDYNLPQFICGLSQIGRTGFYKDRIEKILEEISYEVLTIIPRLHSNRLYLLFALNYATRYFHLDGWKEQVRLLKNEVDFNIVLDREIQPRNIFIDGGLSGIRLLLNNMPELFPIHEICGIEEAINRKITSAQMAESLADPAYWDKRKGLLNGWAGMTLAQDNILKI